MRSIITEPTDGDELTAGDLAVRGVAWSGAAPIARVEVSIGEGPWREARLVGDRHRHSWQWWELISGVEHSGATTIRARATDLASRTQPEGCRGGTRTWHDGQMTAESVAFSFALLVEAMVPPKCSHIYRGRLPRHVDRRGA